MFLHLAFGMPFHTVVRANTYFPNTFTFWGQIFFEEGVIFWGQNFKTGEANTRDRGAAAPPNSNVKKALLARPFTRSHFVIT